MENLSREQPSEQGQQVSGQPARTQAPQSTGVYNQRSPVIAPANQNQSILPDIRAPLPVSNQEVSYIQPITSTLTTNTDLHKQLREDIRKEMELLCGSRLAKRTLEVENFWRAKLEERTKEVEDYWRPNLVLSNGRDDKIKELHEEIEKLKSRLEKGPGLIKAAEERGRRRGELDGYNKISLNPESKPSQDRLNFDFLMKEKDNKIAEMETARDNWFRDTQKYSDDTNAMLRARDQEIQGLRAQLQHPPPQQRLAPGHTDAVISKDQELQARFDSQTQELVSLQKKCNQQADDLATLAARSDRELQASYDREKKMGALMEELENKAKEVSILRRESDQKAVELNGSNEELERMAGEIKILQEGRHQDSKELQKNQQQVEVQSKEIANLQTHHGDSESSNQEEIEFLKAQLAENQLLLNKARSEIISTPQPLLPTLPSAAATPSPSVRRSRFPSSRSILIAILIFLFGFFVPHLHSFANPSSEHEFVGLASRNDRMRWEAWELANRERNEGVPTHEESWIWTQEVGQMGNWGP